MKKLRKVKKLKSWSRQTLWVVLDQQRKRRRGGDDFGGKDGWLSNGLELYSNGERVVS